MSLVQSNSRLQLPETLQTQLHEFQRRVWTLKTIEALCGAVFGVVAAFLALFVLDRMWETPPVVRMGLFAGVMLGVASVPWALHRWVWRQRHLEQLARLLSRKHPHIGDELLGIIELVHSDSEQARSLALCQAAVSQVAEAAQKRDFRDSVPAPRHRLWAGLAAGPVLACAILLALFPAATANAWARLLAPWKDTPRYTFAVIDSLPKSLVVAHGEPFTVAVKLSEKTLSRPDQAVAHFDGQAPVSATLSGDTYTFELPAQIAASDLHIDIGDSWNQMRVDPMLRPELTSVDAEVTLPEYLGQPEVQRKDVRGGQIALVKASTARFTATASRELAGASIDGQPSAPSGAAVTSSSVPVGGDAKVEFRWRDRNGLEGKEPFVLTIAGRDDEAPSLTCEGLPRQKVVLDLEALNFVVHAHDDFGVKVVGIEWQGIESPLVKNPAAGERVLAAGGHDRESMEVGGTFSAKSLGIDPQSLEVRVWVEDYLPGRSRVYSPTYVLHVLNAEQHAIWLTEMLSKWHRQSLEVRDREMQLYETNKQLRALNSEQLDQPENRKRIETQAGAERANGRRLTNLVASGEDLVRQAMRNPEFGVGHLEKWAEMLQILKDISSNRMPSVADLLKQASQAPQVAQAGQKNDKTAMAGQIRSSTSPKPGGETEKDDKKGKTGVPRIVDQESTQQPPDNKPVEPNDQKKKPSDGRLTLPQTTLVGGKAPKNPPPPPPAEEKLDEAVKQQEDLLAEFDKIADELNRVLAELEGSTLVKRLKAASRTQYKIAGRIGDQVASTFGISASRIDNESSQVLAELSGQEAKSSQNVSYIMDDMQAYFERRQFVRFKSVLDEMRQTDVIGSLRQLGDDLKKENGVSIAQAEFWSDTLDRWAEDLVDAGCCGCCPGGKSKASLPPSIILEVLLILEGEVNLRESTRVAEQAKPAIEGAEHKRQAVELSTTQHDLQERVLKVIARINELPEPQANFGRELQLLGMVASVMDEATEILARPDTGSPAIAAETEAIELLLQSKRINPKGQGGGGGPTPGGGGGGDTNDSALALVGGGVNDKEHREDRGISQATGDAGPSHPEEFRTGLTEYFNRLERGAGGE